MRQKDSVIFFMSLAIIVLLASCKADSNTASTGGQGSFNGKNETSDEAPPPLQTVAEPEAPRIVFLNYTISRTSGGSPEVRFINKVMTSGRVKKDVSHAHEVVSGDLKVTELDGSLQPVKSIVIPNPLSRTVEYQDNSGELTKKTLELDSAQFSVRMQLDAKTEAIAVEQVNASGTGTVNLLVTKLN